MFIEYNQNQTFLLPPNFKDFLGDSHQAVILSELIDELDITGLIDEYVDIGRGRPAYHPRMLLKVLFYGYMSKTFSSRNLARKLKSDLGFMYIAGNNTPDFRTINRFRKDKGYILEDIFVQVVLKAKELGMISFGTVNLDGTKMYADASKTKSYTVEKLDKKISKLFLEAEKIDRIEDGLYGEEDGSEIPEDLKTKEGRDKKRGEIKKKKENLELKKKVVKKAIEEKAEQGMKQDRINLTDNDARLVKMKRGDWGVGYNPQNLTENQFILATTVPNSAGDTGELKPIVEKFHENFNVYPDKQVADGGYASEANYQFLEDNNIASYIPHQKGVLDISEYIYDEEKDTYEDREGNVFVFKQNIGKTEGGKKGRPKIGEELKKEEIKATQYIAKTAKGKSKIITVNKNWQQLHKANDERLYSNEGKEIYKKRSGCVENVFGNIKMNFGFERFLLRGFEGVKIERNLISLAHNFQKIINFRLA